MSIIESIYYGISDGRYYVSNIKFNEPVLSSVHGNGYEEGYSGMLYHSDNLSLMKHLLDKGYSGKIQCIYIDPPFFTRAKYKASIDVLSGAKNYKLRLNAYKDWNSNTLRDYIEFISSRLILMRELLSDDGLIWVHLDWHSSHYVRVVMDEIFGPDNFVNEIIWKYKSGGSSKKHFSRKHDTILLYSKTKKYSIDISKEKSYNRELKKYGFRGVNEYKDDFGWYTVVNMKDVWNINMVGRTSSERTGYATQKPLELMKRIITVSSNEGDICADFFCGSGSFLEAAGELNRNWIGCDNELLAVSLSRKRMIGVNLCFNCYFNDSPREGMLRFAPNSVVVLDNGKKLIRCSIESFTPIIDTDDLSTDDSDKINMIVTKNPIDMIDYIMIDNDFTGVFTPEIISYSGSEEFKFITRGNTRFVAVDVFGNEYLCDL